jgi:hypothetical protein
MGPSKRRTSRGPRAADDPWAVAERRSRAVEEPLDLRLTARQPFVRLEVANPLHHSVYEVLFPGAPDLTVALCTCTDFARTGLGTCKHVEAARRFLERHPNAPLQGPAPPPWDGAPAWQEIDRRLADPTVAGLPKSLAWRWAGAVLYERAPPPE